MKLTIATRGSRLAVWQAEHVRDLLLQDPEVDAVELERITTKGDRILDVTLSKVGGKGLFVKELEQALYDGVADLAVHSMKDVPSELPEGLTLACVLDRGNPWDAWVLPEGAPPSTLADFPAGGVVGTSSLRRMCQVKAARPDVTVVPVRGNLDTRLSKLQQSVDGMGAIVLAAAGLERMEMGHRISHRFGVDEMIPAVAQGALGIEIREGDDAVARVVGRLNHPETRDCVTAERALLRTLEGSCQVPLGGYAILEDDEVYLVGFVGEPDGSEVIRGERRGSRSEAAALGRSLGQELLAGGGREILDRLLAEPV